MLKKLDSMGVEAVVGGAGCGIVVTKNTNESQPGQKAESYKVYVKTDCVSDVVHKAEKTVDHVVDAVKDVANNVVKEVKNWLPH